MLIKQNRGYAVYIALFLLICLFPVLGMPFAKTTQHATKEALPALPTLLHEDGKLNLHFLEEFSRYIDYRFAFRQQMITANRMAYAALLRTSTEPDVILGKQGWLFYADTLGSYEGLDAMTDRELWCAAHSLSLIQEQCLQKGAAFRFVVAPNKNTLYGQYMPARYPKNQGASELARLTDFLHQEGVAYVDVYTALAAQEEILYRKHDSHWTTRGAGLAADVIALSLKLPWTPFYGMSYSAVQQEQGDLYTMLYPAGKDLDWDEVYDRPFTFTYTSLIRSAQDTFIYTACPGKTGSLLMFRDSFGNALHPFLAEGFGKATFCRWMPYDLGLLERENADTVIIELVERNLRWLITRPAKFPAPVRTALPQVTLAEQGDVQVRYSEEDGMEGYTMIQGTLPNSPINVNSPVYLRCETQIYEATPTGEHTFTAYLPIEESRLLCGVLAQRDNIVLEYTKINIQDNGGIQ